MYFLGFSNQVSNWLDTEVGTFRLSLGMVELFLVKSFLLESQ